MSCLFIILLLKARPCGLKSTSCLQAKWGLWFNRPWPWPKWTNQKEPNWIFYLVYHDCEESSTILHQWSWFFLFDQRQIGSTSHTLIFVAFIIAAAQLRTCSLLSHYQRIMICPFLIAFIGNKHFWHWMLFLWKKKLTEMLFTSRTRA